MDEDASIIAACATVCVFASLYLVWNHWVFVSSHFPFFSSLRVGELVTISGLINKPDLNLSVATVCSIPDKNGRVPVQLPDGQKLLLQRKNLTRVSPLLGRTVEQRVADASKGLVCIQRDGLYATQFIPEGAVVLADEVLAKVGCGDTDSIHAASRHPLMRRAIETPVAAAASNETSDLLRTHFGTESVSDIINEDAKSEEDLEKCVHHLPPRSRGFCLKSLRRIWGASIGHSPRVITFFSNLLCTEIFDPSIAVLPNSEAKLFAARGINKGERLSVLRGNPYAFTPHYLFKKSLFSYTFVYGKKETEAEKNHREETWIEDITWEHVTAWEKHSHTHAAGLLCLAWQKLGGGHWTCACLVIILISQMSSGVGISKLSSAELARISHFLGYLQKFVLHTVFTLGSVLPHAIPNLFLRKRIAERVVHALEKQLEEGCGEEQALPIKRSLQCLTIIVPFGWVSGWKDGWLKWSREEADLPPRTEVFDYGTIEACLGADLGVDPVRLLASKAKLQQSMDSKTPPLSNPYSSQSQSMDGHIDEMLHTLGHDREEATGEHDSNAYMTLLSKLSHGDDWEDRFQHMQDAKKPT